MKKKRPLRWCVDFKSHQKFFNFLLKTTQISKKIIKIKQLNNMFFYYIVKL